MERTNDPIYQYCLRQSTDLGDLLYELERETHLKTLAPQMMSGPVQGQLLRLLSLWLRPKSILEVGTFTGYATLCLASGLPPDGLLHTIEANPEYAYIIRKYIERAGYQEQIQLHLGKAEDLIDDIPGSFELAFIDAGKRHSRQHYELVVPRLAPGGMLLVDNVLWSGKVLQPKQDKDAGILHAFNSHVQADPRVEQVILPLRDGLSLIRKKDEA